VRVIEIVCLGVVVIFLNSCGGEESSSQSSAQASQQTAQQTSQVTNNTQLTVDAGEDKRAVIFESILMTGTIVSGNKSFLAYQWIRNGKTLATTQAFNYVPTTLGAHQLTFSVQDAEGTKSTDTVNVIVTNKEINITIPKISQSQRTEFVSTVNAARAVTQDCGTKGVWAGTTPISWNDKLYSAAYAHVQDLVHSQTFAHSGSGTESDWAGFPLGIQSTQVERVESYGYEWRGLGENLGGGASIKTADDIVTAWLESDSHCENLMNPDFTEMGMVKLTNPNSLYTNYWAQNFGTPK